MTDAIRDLLISLAAHMAYMQDRLEEGRALEDPEDYYWYRESVLLRQKVTDALADEPAVPDGREPASVTGQPSDQEGPSAEDVEELCEEHCFHVEGYESIECLQGLINEAIARWGNPAPQPPAEGEVAELVRMLTGIAHWRRRGRPGEGDPSPFDIRQADRLDRAAELLKRLSPPQPVPVSERLPRPEEMTEDSEVWIEDPGHNYPLADSGDYDWDPHKWVLRPIGKFDAKNGLRWLPAHALSLPRQEADLP